MVPTLTEEVNDGVKATDLQADQISNQATAEMLSDKPQEESALQLLKDDFKRKMQKDVKKSRHSKHKCKSKA